MTVGTFGVASAAYWWACVAGGLVRLIHYVVGRRAHLWALLMADDLDLEFANAPNLRYTFAMAFYVVFLLAAVLDLPLSCRRRRAGSAAET